MQIDTNATSQEDASAVAAVQGGDTERYRELVERHQRRVYGVAWSHLGDATLAEEATQEAFIRAYQRLRSLTDASKFAAWVSTIARRLAVNFGLSHRRELDKRRRWALDHTDPSDTHPSTPGQNPFLPSDMLRRTLAELPSTDRECLVLFYLEGKSGADAAASLGISDTAFRARLRRARAILRERLEEKLESSLEELRPPESLTPAIMSGVLAASSAKAMSGGLAAKLASLLGKKFLFSGLPQLFSLLASLPALCIAWILGRMERRNFQDPDGFRPRLHQYALRSFLWGFPLTLAIFSLILRSTPASWGISGRQALLLALLLPVTLIGARSAFFFRDRRTFGAFIYCAIITIGTVLLATGIIPIAFAGVPILAATLWFYFVMLKYREAGMRMDLNLFLRARQGMLKPDVNTVPQENSPLTTRADLRHFARFLGSSFLVSDFRWTSQGLALSLPPVKNSFIAAMAGVFLPPAGPRTSRVLLDWQGNVSAQCGKADLAALDTISAGTAADPISLAAIVSRAVQNAWTEFRAGNTQTAANILGAVPDSDLFHVPPSRSSAARGWRIVTAVAALLMIASLGFRFLNPVWLSGLKPVDTSEPQIIEFLNKPRSSPATGPSSPNSPSMALFNCLVLPPARFFRPETVSAMRDEIAGPGGFAAWSKSQDPLTRVFSAPLPRRAIAARWITWADVASTPRAAAAFLHTNQPPFFSPSNWDHFLTRLDSWSWVAEQRQSVLRVQSSGLDDLRLLRDLGCLDLVDREKLSARVIPVQTLSATPSGEPPVHDWQDVQGLFFTPGWPALQDTYYALATLDILGALDKIDREQCVRGILRLHRGAGYFTSPDSGGFNEYQVDGSARDTITAYESLRLLGALDRVSDLDQWRFRPLRQNVAPGDLTWHDVEAWVCTKRLQAMLAARKQNPQTPFRSLLDSE